MNQQSFQKKLAKISALTDGGDSLGRLSALERDLLLGYIRELYEIALEEPGHVTYKANVQENETASAGKPISAMPHDATGIVSQVETLISPAPVVVPEAPGTPVSGPNLAPEAQQISIPVNASGPTVKVIPEMPHDATSIVAPAEVVSSLEVKASVVALQSDAVNDIFAVGVISDLSDKLANAPIGDLNKAMGINERMFTQQELFGNDAQVFGETLKKMNTFGSFEEARQYLLDHIIYTFDWTSDAKIKKAATFVRMVRRRYL